MELKQQVAAMLAWYMQSGVEIATAPTPINYFAMTKIIPPKAATQQKYEAPINRAVQADDASEATAIAAKATTIAELQQLMRNFELCDLKKTATNTVLGVGNAAAEILIIGDVPSMEDDAIGIAFSDASGELLHKMMAAIGVNLRENCFALHLSPWRIMANRLITPDEAALCLPFVKRHIELAQPRIIISLGSIPASGLLNKNMTINNLRGKPNLYENIAVFTTYHPNILQKNTELKRYAWQDLLEIKAHISHVN